MLVFEERGKSEYPEKNLKGQSREPTNEAHLHIWCRGTLTKRLHVYHIIIEGSPFNGAGKLTDQFNEQL